MLLSQVFYSRKCLKDQLIGPTGRVSNEGRSVRGSFPEVFDVDDSVEGMEDYRAPYSLSGRGSQSSPEARANPGK